MSYPFNYPTSTNANIQIFSAQASNSSFAWEKPQGVSFVWFTLIGCGGYGSGGNGTSAGGGGGSGAVTNCLMPAFLIPDTLNIKVSNGRSTLAPTQINYRLKSTDYTLLSANNGNPGAAASGGSGATASSSTNFSAAGLFQSVGGQNGVVGTNQSASTTTFLTGGAGANSTTTVTGNYGYSHSGGQGYFQMSPIIVGIGGSNFNTTSGNGDVGCGGGGNIASDFTYGFGGPGMVIIISW